MSSCLREAVCLTLGGMITAGAVPRYVSLDGPHPWPGEKGEKTPVGTGSQTPGSRCFWPFLVLPSFRYYSETRSVSGAAKRPVSNPLREVGAGPCLWPGTGWQEKFTMDTRPLLGAGWAAWDLQEELSCAPDSFGNEPWS